MIRPTPSQRAEMAAFIDEKQPGLLDELGIDRAEGTIPDRTFTPPWTIYTDD